MDVCVTIPLFTAVRYRTSLKGGIRMLTGWGRVGACGKSSGAQMLEASRPKKKAFLPMHCVPAQWLLAIGTYLLIGALLLSGLIAYRTSGESGQSLWSGRLRWLTVALLLGASAGVGLLALAYKRSAGDRKALWLLLAINVSAVLVCFGLAEVSLRVIAHPDPLGVRIGEIPLVPYDWKAFTSTNLSYLNRSRSDTSFFVEDPLLGWTVGSSRESQDGMYKSSTEGLRSMRRGETLGTKPFTQRIALFGDSFTFGMDVPFEQSWSHHLALNLPAAQVLNFGVDGYGVDQAYLRFKRDGAQWAPWVSVLSFIQDDLYRCASVYPFLRGWEYPFSKPRFIQDGGKLQLLNVPNLPPGTIFASRSIWELPLLDLDLQFDPYRWKQHPLRGSYLLRLIATEFPVWPVRTAQTSDEVIAQLGSRLIEEFVTTARDRGTEPLIVYLPSRSHFEAGGGQLKNRAGEILAPLEIQIHDLTSCLTAKVPREQLFLNGKPHYSAAGNEAVAECLQPLVAAFLQR